MISDVAGFERNRFASYLFCVKRVVVSRREVAVFIPLTKPGCKCAMRPLAYKNPTPPGFKYFLCFFCLTLCWFLSTSHAVLGYSVIYLCSASTEVPEMAVPRTDNGTKAKLKWYVYSKMKINYIQERREVYS